MKLCSIVNSWVDSLELLPFCITNHLQFCDHVIVVWSMNSNRGTYDDSMLDFILKHKSTPNVTFHQLEPKQGLTPLTNEIMKRNYGIDIAKQSGFTHFLIADQDEFYQASVMKLVKQQVEKEDLNGIVSKIVVYIGKPTLWCHDHTIVPTIHKLTKDSQVGAFRQYPFAYDVDGNAHVDPSRRPSYLNGIKLSGAIMHHMSYVRKNIDLKIDNSSANLRRSRQVIYDELRDAKPGYISKLYHQPLQECPNYFGIQI